MCHESPNHSRNRLTLWGAAPIPREKGADTIREKIYEYPQELRIKKSKRSLQKQKSAGYPQLNMSNKER